MTPDILIYRCLRLWKVAVLGALAPIATVLAAAHYHGADFSILMGLALALPALHAVRYPGMWLETLTVSLVLSPCLWLAAMIGPDLSTGEQIWRIFWLCVMALVLFFLTVSPMAWLALIGPGRVLTAGASRTSRLDPETLRAAITLYPGQTNDRYICGAADEKGVFPITMLPAPVDAVKYEIRPELTDGFPIDSEDMDEEDDDDDISRAFQAVVHSSGPDHHEIFTYFASGEIGAVRYTFQALRAGGTRVTVRETGHHMPYVQIFGFWLTGFMTDYLTYELDRAEGRAPRANRAFPQKQLVVDIANLILPFLGGTRVERPGT